MTGERDGRERVERTIGPQANGTSARTQHRSTGPTGASSQAPEIESLALEAALEELDRIVAALEDGRLALDDSLALYERGMRLTKHCQEILDTAELRVQRLRPAPGATGRGDAYVLDDFEADEDE